MIDESSGNFSEYSGYSTSLDSKRSLSTEETILEKLNNENLSGLESFSGTSLHLETSTLKNDLKKSFKTNTNVYKTNSKQSSIVFHESPNHLMNYAIEKKQKGRFIFNIK